MLARIALFEWRYQIKAPLFWIGAAIFFLLTFGSVTVDQIQIGARGNVHVNAPYAILQTLGIMNVFGVFLVIAFVANVVIRDDETGFAPIIRATPVGKRAYLIGRFVGASAVAFLVLASVPLAILAGSWMPWLDPEKVGPLRWADYLYALFVFGLPTLLAISAGFFALATATRSMMWTYVGALAFLVLFFVSRGLLRDPQYDTIAALSDPFGLSALTTATKYWTAAERNSQLPPIEGLLLMNRLLWSGVALALFALAYRLFRFEAGGRRAERKAARVRRAKDAEAAPPARPAALAAAVAARPARFAALWALTRFDMAAVFKSPAFFVLLAIGGFNAYGGMAFRTDLYGVSIYPVTRALVEALVGSFSIIPIIIAIYYAGELVWRDRQQRIHEIVDATPAPDWAFVLPKIAAIALVLAATSLAGVAVALGVQLFAGYTTFELGHYLTWFVLPTTVTALLLAVLSVFVQALVPHKAIGWAVMLLYLVASVALANAGFEHNLYNYAGTPLVPLSDMNGSGRFAAAAWWFLAYWSAFAALLGVLAYALWRRGAETRLAPRLRRLPRRLAGPAGWFFGTAAVAWLGLGGFIFYNTNVLNRYLTTPEREELQAEYEKTLLPYEKVPQPRITDVKLEVALYPREVRAVTRGSYRIENRTGQPLDAVHLRWFEPLTMDELVVEGAKPQKDYGDFRYRIYRFDPPLAPGEARTIRFATTLQERGFPNSRPLTRIVGNGSFLNNSLVAPQVGMDRGGLLQERAKRRKYGLPPELRPARLEDEAARATNVLRRDSDWVNAEIVLSTDADQIPIAPGRTVSNTTAGGRRTLVTRTEAPIQHFFSLQSARYAVRSDRWNDVELAVYHHPAHDYNVERMLAAMKTSLDVFSTAFGPYQFKQARILEFPAYDRFAQSFANTIPYSEAIGFVLDLRDLDKIDAVTFVTAHEMAHQWWGHQVIGADKQGSTMLIETFSQYGALLVMEKLLGKDQIRRFLKYELDAYLRSRGGEVVEELPLARVEDQPYIHYRKGALAMYWLKELVGEAAVNRAMQKLIAEYGFKPAPYPDTRDFLRLLRAEAGPQHDAAIADLFERITIYDVKATDAKAKQRADGRFEVAFTVEARKRYADGKGVETEAPMAEPFEIGVFTAEPGHKSFAATDVLLFERRELRDGKTEVKLVVDKKPTHVGVDPYNKRIDRNSDDNVVKVDSD